MPRDGKINPHNPAVLGGGVKILIATGIYPPDIGGPATMLGNLVISLIEKDFFVRVITYSKKLSVDYVSANEPNVYRVIKSKSNIINYIKYFFKLLQLSFWSDIIYVTETYSVGYFVYLIKKIFRKKYIVRFAGDSAWEASMSGGLVSDNIIEFQNKTYSSEVEKLKKKRKKILQNADGVIAVSEFMVELLKKIGINENKIKMIYNSIDFFNEKNVSDSDVDKIRAKYGQGAKIIVTSCRLTRWKGVSDIIETLPRVKKKIGAVKFIVLGDGPEMENLKKTAKKSGVESDVDFIGKVQEEDTFAFIKVADLYVLNSSYEGLSHALLNAMRLGTPIVATNVGGNPEVIENNHNGLLVEYANQVELLDAVVKILSDEILSKKFINNSTEELKKFSWTKNINSTTDLLKKIHNEKSTAN